MVTREAKVFWRKVSCELFYSHVVQEMFAKTLHSPLSASCNICFHIHFLALQLFFALLYVLELAKNAVMQCSDKGKERSVQRSPRTGLNFKKSSIPCKPHLTDVWRSLRQMVSVGGLGESLHLHLSCASVLEQEQSLTCHQLCLPVYFKEKRQTKRGLKVREK